jgi:hypothetical protein
MAAVDAALAGRITRCGALSVAKTEAAIDALVEEFDPDALRRARESVSRPTVEFGSPSDVAGTTSMWARLYAADAVLLEARVEEMARSVCAEDPRSIDERRAAALIALGARTELACARTQPDCGAGPRDQPPAKNAVVYVIAEQESVDTATTAAAATEPVAEPVPREVRHPGDTAPEPRYTPSRTIAEFVRCRDLTCRFPGCDKPAQVCDSDHTVPYPVGPTHPSNLKCLCRFHHLLKTFWNGVTGWRDRQLSDGTVVWTSPTGHTYTTYPGSLHLFPTLCAPSATLSTGDPPVVQPTGGGGMKMPKRRHTRAHNTAKAKAAERRLNDALVAERNKPPPF